MSVWYGRYVQLDEQKKIESHEGKINKIYRNVSRRGQMNEGEIKKLRR